MPDIILARADKQIPKAILEKISMFCDVDKDAVIPTRTLDSIYKVPLALEKYEISKVISKKLCLIYKEPKMEKWEKFSEDFDQAKDELKIWLAVKYHGLEDAYISVIESLKFACTSLGKKLSLEWIDTEKIEEWDNEELEKLKNVKWVCVPGGFWKRWIEWKIKVATYARENKLPYLWLCLGSQILAIEFARSIWLKWANSEEFDEKCKNKIVHFLPGQSKNSEIWGTLRLWAYPCVLKKDTVAYKAYKKEKISERHRHRYEFNNKFKAELEKKWLVISGSSPDWNLMEIVEIKDHPFMLGSQFHPEFKSRMGKPHPLFESFIKASKN